MKRKKVDKDIFVSAKSPEETKESESVVFVAARQRKLGVYSKEDKY